MTEGSVTACLEWVRLEAPVTGATRAGKQLSSRAWL